MGNNWQPFFKNLKKDFPASIVVYLVALPLCLGVGLASTGNPDLIFSGIIAGVVGGIVVGLLSGSALGVSGPAAGLITIVLAAISTLGSFENFLVAVVLAGVIQIIAGFLKAGVIGYYFPSSVIKGMLAAIGIILILKEIPHAFGYDEDFIGDRTFINQDGNNTFTEIIQAFYQSQWGAIIISLISLSILLLFDTKRVKKNKLFNYLPGALFVVIIGVILNSIFSVYIPDLELKGKHLVQLDVISSFNDFKNLFIFPNWNALYQPNVYVIAITIAIIASLETLLSVEATDKLDPYKRITPTNKELKAQGIGNIISGLFGGLPITQVVVRSSANVNSGGRTKMAAILHGVILLVSVITISNLLNLIPLASLAAILILIGYKLAQPILFVSIYKLGWNQFLPFVLTIIVVIFTDLLKGIGVGIFVAFLFILSNYRFALKNSFKSIFHAFNEEKIENGTRLILAKEVNFFNKGAISKVMRDLPEDSNLEIDGTHSTYIDYDVKEVIQAYKAHTAKIKNINVVLKGITETKMIQGH